MINRANLIALILCKIATIIGGLFLLATSGPGVGLSMYIINLIPEVLITLGIGFVVTPESDTQPLEPIYYNGLCISLILSTLSAAFLGMMPYLFPNVILSTPDKMGVIVTCLCKFLIGTGLHAIIFFKDKVENRPEPEHNIFDRISQGYLQTAKGQQLLRYCRTHYSYPSIIQEEIRALQQERQALEQQSQALEQRIQTFQQEIPQGPNNQNLAGIPGCN